MLCDQEKWNSANITLTVTDSLTEEPVPESMVEYSVGQEHCFIGETDTNGTLISKFPTGTLNGLVTANHLDYLANGTFLDAGDDELEIEITLNPKIVKNVTLLKKKLVKTGSGERSWSFDDQTYYLRNNERVIAIFKRVPDDWIVADDHTQVSQFGNTTESGSIALTQDEVGLAEETSLPLINQVEQEFAQGWYEVEIYLLLRDVYYRIPEREEEADGGFWSDLFGGEETYTIPEVEINGTLYTGGLAFKNESAYFKVKKNDLLSNKSLVIYLLDFDLTGIPESQRRIEDLEQMSSIEENSRSYWSSLYPKWVNKNGLQQELNQALEDTPVISSTPSPGGSGEEAGQGGTGEEEI